MKINILRAFWNFEVNELSTASGGKGQILRPPRAAKSVVTPLVNGDRPYHVQAIHRIRHLLSPELAQTLACSLILSRLDYCNAVHHGAPTGTIQKLQRVQKN